MYILCPYFCLNHFSSTKVFKVQHVHKLKLCKWGIFALVESLKQSHLHELWITQFFSSPKIRVMQEPSMQTFFVTLGTGPTYVKTVVHYIHKQHILLLAIIFLPKILYILYLFSKVGFSIHDQCAEKAKTMSKLMI